MVFIMMNRKYSDEERRLRRRKSSSNYYSHKEECQKRTREYYLKNQVKAILCNRNSSLKRDYGITQDDYEDMWIKQGGKCAVCERDDNNGKRFVIDHKHDTEIIRGLLCGNCNRAISLMKDNPDILEKAAKYLRD
jgi:hypothetical protein